MIEQSPKLGLKKIRSAYGISSYEEYLASCLALLYQLSSLRKSIFFAGGLTVALGYAGLM